MNLTPSDYAFMACLIAAIAFAINFAVGRPRVWFRDPLGWVLFLYGLSTVALLVLIVYGVVFGQRVDEPYRFAVGLALVISLSAKNVILHTERKRGRRPGERPVKRKKG